jgi:hypothetical protein
MQPKLISVKPSPRKAKKYVATFDDGTTTHFGGTWCGDFIIYSAQDRKLADRKRAAYLARHGATESWADPTTAASLSRFILWEHRTLPQAIRKYASHFGKR